MINASESEIRGVQQRRSNEGVYSEYPIPSFFEGSGESAVSGLYAGALEATISALDPILAHAEDEGGIAGFASGLTRKVLIDTYDRTRPNPNTTGKAAQVIYGLTSVLPQAVAATEGLGVLGGSALTGYAQGYTDYRLARKEGLDEATAIKRGVITGLTMAAGVVAPASLGVSLPARIASGAAINTTLGTVQRGATSKILDDAGYHDMASQYKIFDPWAMTADAILGGAFGGLGARAKDAGLTVNDALQFEESGFGIPTDGKTRSAHTKAMETAAEQVLKGEEVNVADHFLGETNFVPKPVDIEASRAYEDAFKEMGLADLLDEAKAQEDQASVIKDQSPTDLSSSGISETPFSPISKTEPPRDHVPPSHISEASPPEGVFTTRETTPSTQEGGVVPSIAEYTSIPKAYHTVENPATIKEIAAEIEPHLKRLIENSVKDVVGAEVYGTRLKTEESLGNKALSKDALAIGDYVGGRVVTDNPQAQQRVLGNLNKSSNVMEVDDYTVRPKESGYRAVHLQVMSDKGVSAEIQIQPREIHETQKIIHPEYKKWQKITSHGELKAKQAKQYAEFRKFQRKTFDDAWKKYLERQKNIKPDDVTGDILAEKPGMEIPAENGEIKATDALKAADEEIKSAEESPKIFDAAINCFLRKGQ